MKKSKSLLSACLVATIFLFMAYASAPPKIVSTKYDGLFKYNAPEPEIVKNDAKLKFFKDVASPTIVLRVPHSNKDVLEEDKSVKTNNSQTTNLYDVNVYNVIEKELLKGGFTVRDRALFDKVLGDKNVQDYSKIKELTETDLILELSNIEFVPYAFSSFTYYTNGRKNVVKENTMNCSNNIRLYGLKLELRLVKVKENDFIGSFTYNLAPVCLNSNCNFSVDVTNNQCSEPYVVQGNVRYSGVQLIPKTDVEKFVRASSQKLVAEIMHK